MAGEDRYAQHKNAQPESSRVLTSGLLRGPDVWSKPVPAISTTRDWLTYLENHEASAPALLERARSGIAAIVEARIGGDCWSPAVGLAPEDRAPSLLLVAHDTDDPFLPEMGVDAAVLMAMYDAADHAAAGRRIIAVAPGIRSRTARNRLRLLAAARGWRLIDRPVDPWTVLDHANLVFTIGHEIGFLALLKGLEVHCHGRPAYGGWGLTIDAAPAASRGQRRSREEVFAACCILGTRYTDPFTGEACSFEDAVTLLSDWRRVADQNQRIVSCVGMSIWKQGRMRDLLAAPGHAPRFRTRTAAAVRLAKAEGGAVAVWATREPPDLARAAEGAGVPVVRVEDGFLRSVGLGADFMPAASIIADRKGLYYDPSAPSGLDDILSTTDFSPALLERARKLTHKLVAGGITKYNVGGDMPYIGAPSGARILFVPGQVENDRSVLLGGTGTYSNFELLKQVRHANSDAFILYKPHPDVDAGYRPGAIPDADALRLADRVVRGVSSAAIIAAVDEIHTLTSLVGFEALVRGKHVVVYGQPFYAGWGLTRDHAPVPHRTRRLTLEQLVAGVLILYPRYIDPVTRLPCGPEVLIERLSHPELWRPGLLVRLRRIQGAVTRRLRNHLAPALPTHP